MPSPFDPYFSLYTSGTWSERPWWRRALSGVVMVSESPILPCAWLRQDGVKGPEFPWAAGEPDVPTPEDAEAMREIDLDSPIPPPAPTPTQVWVDPGGAFSVVDVSTHGVMVLRYRVMEIEGSDRLGHTLARVFKDGDLLPSWPPRGAVLVAGPTPWGRDRPWAPPGWSP